MAALPSCTCTARMSLSRSARTGLQPLSRAQSTFQWRRALPEGQLPAYDEALKYLAQDRQEKRERVDALRRALSAAQDATERATLAAQVEELEAFADINDPETRAMFERGQGQSGL
jgi:large subunit ribosomal protein L35